MKMNFKIFSILFFCICVGCDLGEKKDCIEEENKIMVFKAGNGKWRIDCLNSNGACKRPYRAIEEYIYSLGWGHGQVTTKKGERIIIVSVTGSNRILLFDEYKIRCLLDGLTKMAQFSELTIDSLSTRDTSDISREEKLTSRFDAGEMGVAYDTSQDEHESSMAQSLFMNGRRICLYKYREDEKGGSEEEFKCKSGVTFQSLMQDLERNGITVAEYTVSKTHLCYAVVVKSSQYKRGLKPCQIKLEDCSLYPAPPVPGSAM
jgi:hypothetical protein